MKPKILIIDDEPDIRAYLAAAVEDNGFEPMMLDEGDSIARTINANRPDLIVLDIMMPMRSGISIYKAIRSNLSFHIPVILISGMAGASDFMNTGFKKLANDDRIPLPDGFIEKPVDIDILIQKINDLIGPVPL